MFASRGYHATTTRQIADAVGIRQPSLFHHFKSKGAILEALLRWDLDHILPYTQALAAERDSPAARLYRYLVHDLTHLANAPYSLAAAYAEDVIGDPAFAVWSRKRARLHAAVERIIRAGVESGEFADFNPAVVREMVVGILVRTSAAGSDEPAVIHLDPVVGAWSCAIPPAGGAPAFALIKTVHAGGTLTEIDTAAPPSQESPTVGTWTKTGDRTYGQKAYQQVWDASGNLVGTFHYSAPMTLAHSLKVLDIEGTATLYDPNGHVVTSFPFTGHCTRA